MIFYLLANIIGFEVCYIFWSTSQIYQFSILILFSVIYHEVSPTDLNEDEEM